MKWILLMVPAENRDAEYRLEVDGGALPSVGDHVVVHEGQKKEVLKVQRIVHSLNRGVQEAAVDEITVEGSPIDQLSTNVNQG